MPLLPILLFKVVIVTAIVGVAVGAALYEGHPPFRNWVDEQFDTGAYAMGVNSGYDSDEEKELESRLRQLRSRTKREDDDDEDYVDDRTQIFNEKSERHEKHTKPESGDSSDRDSVHDHAVTSGMNPTGGSIRLRQRNQAIAAFRSGCAYADPFADETTVLFDRDEQNDQSSSSKTDMSNSQATLTPTTTATESISSSTEPFHSLESLPIHEVDEPLTDELPPPPPPRPSSSTAISPALDVSALEGDQPQVSPQSPPQLERQSSTPPPRHNEKEKTAASLTTPNPWTQSSDGVHGDLAVISHGVSSPSVDYLQSPLMSEPSIVGWDNTDDEGGHSRAPSVASSSLSYHFIDENEGMSRMPSPTPGSSSIISGVTNPRVPGFSSFQPMLFPPSRHELVPEAHSDGEWMMDLEESASTTSWDSIDSEESLAERRP